MSNRKSRLQKRRRRSIIAFDMILLNRTATEPLHEQLYRQIRDELKSGKFSDASSRLPSTRALATDQESQDRRLDSRFQNFMPKVISAQNPGPGHSLRTFSRRAFDCGPTETLPTNSAPISHF